MGQTIVLELALPWLQVEREREEQIPNCKQKLHQMEVGKPFINQTHFHLLVSS